MAVKSYKKWSKEVEKVIPTADFEEDEYGQIIIYTNLMWGAGGKIVPFEPEDEE